MIRDARFETNIIAVHGASRVTLWGQFPFSMSETEIANYGEYQRRSKLSLGEEDLIDLHNLFEQIFMTKGKQ